MFQFSSWNNFFFFFSSFSFQVEANENFLFLSFIGVLYSFYTCKNIAEREAPIRIKVREKLRRNWPFLTVRNKIKTNSSIRTETWTRGTSDQIVALSETRTEIGNYQGVHLTRLSLSGPTTDLHQIRNYPLFDIQLSAFH